MVADEHIDRAGLFDSLSDGISIPYIGAEDGNVGAGGLADGGAGLLELVGVSCENRDPGAVQGGLPGESKSDAAGAAGDEHVAVFDWDLDGAGTDEKVEEQEEGTREKEEEEEEEEKEERRH